MGFLIDHHRWRDTALCCLATALCISTACAGLHPPLTTSAGDDPSFELRPHRADPDGLALTLHASEAAPGDELELWRRPEGGDWTLVETLDVNEPLADALSTGRVEWHDPLGDRPASLQYRMRLHAQTSDTTDPVDVDWRGVPEAPAPEATTRQDPTVTIRLSWDAALSHRALILRRDVLHDDDYAPLATVDPGAGGVFDDGDVDPGGVYAYRVQLIDHLGAFPRHGPFSESLYVSLPD